MNSSNFFSFYLIVFIISALVLSGNFYRIINLDNWRRYLLLRIFLGIAQIIAITFVFILPVLSQVNIASFSLSTLFSSPVTQVALFEILIISIILYQVHLPSSLLDFFAGEKHYYGECTAYTQLHQGKSSYWEYFVEFFPSADRKQLRIQVTPEQFIRLFGEYMMNPEAAIGRRAQVDIFYLQNLKVALLVK